MLQAQDLTKFYGKKRILNHLNFQLKKGSIHGLVGINGAGKTTFLNLLSGIYMPDSGKITYANQPLLKNDHLKSNLFYLPDRITYTQTTSLKSLAAFYSKIYPNWSHERYQQLISEFQFKPQQFIFQLSKGQKRLIAFILALSAQTNVLILDEPFDGLDPTLKQLVKNLMIQDVATRELSILVSAHNLRELESFCDTISLLKEGEILLSEDLDLLKTRYHKFQVAYASPTPLLTLKDFHKSKILQAEVRGHAHLYVLKGDSDAIDTCIQATHPLIFDTLPLSLEEIFIYEMEEREYDPSQIFL